MVLFSHHITELTKNKNSTLSFVRRIKKWKNGTKKSFFLNATKTNDKKIIEDDDGMNVEMVWIFFRFNEKKFPRHKMERDWRDKE